LDHSRREDVAKPVSRVRSWGTIAAFTLIIALTIIEGVDEGLSLWDWLVIGVGVAAILQAISHLSRHEARA
jgi:hypothetical protein